jgi:hypothetical protein
MGQVANNPGEWTLSSLNDATGWFPSSGLDDDPCFSVTGTFVGTIAVQTSNQSDYVKTRIRQETETYSTPAGPLAIRRVAARYFRFVMIAYTSGTAYIGLAAPNRAGENGTSSTILPQTDTNADVNVSNRDNFV